MKHIITRIALAAAVAACLSAGSATAAPLTITLSPMPVIGAPGSEVVIDITIENTTGYTVDNLSANYTVPDPIAVGSVDTSWFDTFGFLPLAPDASFSGVVHFVFSPTAPLMEWESFQIEFAYDLFDDAGDSIDVAVSSFAGFRAQAVPEPASMTLFGLALAGAAFARRRRQA